MARIDRLITPSVSVFPLEIPTQTVQQSSGFPRAVVEVHAPVQSVAAPGAGNQIQIYQDYVLPKNFAYLYLSTDLMLSHSDETVMDDTYQPYQTILGRNVGDKTWDTPLRQVAPTADSSTDAKRWFLYAEATSNYGTNWYDPNPTKDVMFNDKSENLRVKNYLYNTNGTGYGLSFLYSYRARFLQIDLSQAYAFAINNTLATR